MIIRNHFSPNTLYPPPSPVISELTTDEEGKVDEVLAFFIAGQETVAHTMTFALSHVGAACNRSLG